MLHKLGQIKLLSLLKCVIITIFVSIVLAAFLSFEETIEYIDDEESVRAAIHFQNVGPATVQNAADIRDPIVIWWTPFTKESGRMKSCGADQCFFTVNRTYASHPQTKVFMFYGSDFDFGDLPLPRLPHQDWALLHEESPRNALHLFSHTETMSLFNHTSTFRRESDSPLTTLYLDSIESLESKQYMVSTAEKNRLIVDEDLALVSYVQTDCTSLSDRDSLVQMLQRRIRVDSYGGCLHNRDLPPHLRDNIEAMSHPDFLRLLAKYKFNLALENAVCDDYITEKFWRPFRTGSVPIVYGSPSVKDFLPSEKSAIIVNDFSSIDDLVNLLLHLNASDDEYEAYLSYKHTGVTNDRLRQIVNNRDWRVNAWPAPNFVDSFECLVCRRAHEQRKSPSREFRANVNHYGCQTPQRFSDRPKGSLRLVDNPQWSVQWEMSKLYAVAMRQLMNERNNFTRNDVFDRAAKLRNVK